MKKTFVISDEIIQGVIFADDLEELKTKLKVLFEGIREPIFEIDLPDLEDLNDM